MSNPGGLSANQDAGDAPDPQSYPPVGYTQAPSNAPPDPMSGLVTQLQGTGWDPSMGLQSGETMLQDMAMTGRGWQSFQIPPGVTPGDWMQMLSFADQFAQQTGYAYFPTTQQFQRMAQIGAGNTPALYRYLASATGASSKFPWAAAGMTAQQYQQQTASMQATIAEYTGNPNAYAGLVSTALARGWSSSNVMQELFNNKSYWKTAPWLQFQMTKQNWTDYKLQNTGAVTQQYGAKAANGDAAFVNFKQEPQVNRPQSGGAISQSSAPSGGLVKPPGQSQVR